MRLLPLSAAVVSTAASLAVPAFAHRAADPAPGKYAGRAASTVPGTTPHSIVLRIAHGRCSTPAGAVRQVAYCVTVDPQSIVQAACAGSGYFYIVFFPVTQPIALSPTGRIDHEYTLYVKNGQTYPSRVAGGVKVGTFELTLAAGGRAAVSGSEHYRADLGEGDGVCDTGVVKITAGTALT